MQHLSQGSFQKFSQTLQELYQICSIEDFPSHLLSVVSKFIPAIDYTYITISFKTRHATVMNYQPAAGVDPLDTANFERIAHQHFYENPLAVNYLRTRDNGAHKVSDFLNEQQLHCLEGLYGKYMQPRGIKDLIAVSFPIPLETPCRSSLSNRPADVIMLMLMDDQIYTERDRFILNTLHPHLLQAQRNTEKFTQIQKDWIQQRHTLDALGVIALDGSGQVQFLSRQAEQWLKQYFPDSRYSARYLPDHLQRWVNYQLALFTQDAIPLPHLPLKLEQEGSQLVVRFITGQSEQYLLLLEERQFLPLSPTALELLGLTKREAAVLFEVTQGKTNPEIAAALSLKTGTVRKYLEHIYTKLEVQTRAEAVVWALKQLGTCLQF